MADRPSTSASTVSKAWGARCVMGGVLMGLANLVPGISGGTMLLAAGVYPRFIEAIAEVSRLRLSKSVLFVLGLITGSAALAILLGAGPVKDAVIAHRWAMYSLFIGLTLGGVPLLWRMARPATGQFWVGMLAGLVVMVALAWLQVRGEGSGVHREGWLLMFVAGAAGASAMILPGVSGGYLLLIMGVYVPVLGAIDALKEALERGNPMSAQEPVLTIVLPVGLGVLVGVFMISNLIKMLLERHQQPSLGVLMGLLVGAVFGLWPFQHGVAPKVGDLFEGTPLTAESVAALTPEKYPTELYVPDVMRIVGALALIALGIAITALVARLGRSR